MRLEAQEAGRSIGTELLAYPTREGSDLPVLVDSDLGPGSVPLLFGGPEARLLVEVDFVRGHLDPGSDIGSNAVTHGASTFYPGQDQLG